MTNPLKWLVPYLMLSVGLTVVVYFAQYEAAPSQRTHLGAVLCGLGIGLCLLSIPLSFELGKRESSKSKVKNKPRLP